MPMNNRLLVPRKVPGLLDLVPGAVAAYSLRSLSNSYAGPVVTVRRSSDDAEDSFTASEVSDGTLAAFCGAGDGCVKTWHSQTGSINASQATAAYQPKIVSSGVVVTEEGKPAIYFDGTDDFLVASYTTHAAPQNWTFAFVHTPDGAPAVGEAPFSYHDTSTRSDGLVIQQNTGVQPTIPPRVAYPTVQSLMVYIQSGSQDYFFLNGVEYATPGNITGAYNGPLVIGKRDKGDIEMACWWQELIVYPSDQTANRELLEGLIAWGWSV